MITTGLPAYKVAETFDATVGEWLDGRAAEQGRRGRPREPSPQPRKRLAFLCELLQPDEADVLGLRYQLPHRTAAAVLEAQRFAAHQASMLVHSSVPKTPGSTTTKLSSTESAHAAALARSSPSASAVASPSTSAGFAPRSARMYFD